MNGKVAKICDFGLADLLFSDRSYVNLTGSRISMGTVNYMAPEQRQDAGGVDQRADVFFLRRRDLRVVDRAAARRAFLRAVRRKSCARSPNRSARHARRSRPTREIDSRWCARWSSDSSRSVAAASEESAMRRLFVTGATGFLGREVLARLAKRRWPTLVTMRRRGDDDTKEAAKARLLQVIRGVDPDETLETVDVTFADVSVPGLGLDLSAVDWLENDPTPVQMIHGAAQVRFDLPWEVMETQNVTGTENVIALGEQLADRGLLYRLDYVSTSFVAGDRVGLFFEDELSAGQTPRNDYEKSKLLAEGRVHAAEQTGLPATVHRPSIIVGDSRTGRASSFKVLYWPLKVYARGRWRTVFGEPSCTIDVVPVDFVADAMMHLLDREDAVGRTFHLAAGPERQSTIGELAAMAESAVRTKAAPLHRSGFVHEVASPGRSPDPEVGSP